jgi:hypothetical protein
VPHYLVVHPLPLLLRGTALLLLPRDESVLGRVPIGHLLSQHDDVLKIQILKRLLGKVRAAQAVAFDAMLYKVFKVGEVNVIFTDCAV